MKVNGEEVRGIQVGSLVEWTDGSEGDDIPSPLVVAEVGDEFVLVSIVNGASYSYDTMDGLRAVVKLVEGELTISN